MIIGTNSKKITTDKYGRKANYLNWLNSKNFKIPESVYLPIDFDVGDENHRHQLLPYIANFEKNGRYHIAIRSSSILEDSIENSYAGHFQTYLGEFSTSEIFEKITKVQESDGRNDKSMGVIIQELITPKYSGVLFTSDPLTKSKSKGIIQYVEGMGDKLVSGKEAGTDVPVDYDQQNNFAIKQFHQLVKSGKSIQSKLQLPVDIEWAIDKQDRIWILQVRPISTIFYSDGQSGFHKISMDIKDILPKDLRENPKIRIRLLADQYDVRVSPAHILLSNHVTDSPKIHTEIPIQRSEFCDGHSTVILQPKLIDGQIQRFFADNNISDKNFIRFCQRYGIRAIDNRKSVNASLYKLGKLVAPLYWTSAIIIQEFWKSGFSGILKKTSEQYILEIAKGQFLAKGVVEPSKYYFDTNKALIDKIELSQLYQANIENGEIIEEYFEEPYQIKFQENELLNIINEFDPLLQSHDFVIEFALLDTGGDRIVPFLFDLVEDSSSDNLSLDQIQSGVISPGKISGKLHYISRNAIEDPESVIDFHFHDETEDDTIIKNNENIIFYSKLPDISLLKILKRYDTNKIGFIFERGSILSHFAILLREKSIPAIYINDTISEGENSDITIDAISNLEQSDRWYIELE